MHTAVGTCCCLGQRSQKSLVLLTAVEKSTDGAVHASTAILQPTSSKLETVCVALCSSCAIFSSSRTAAPSAAYNFFKFSRVRVLLSVIDATDCRKCMRSASVLISSDRFDSGEILV